MLRLSKFHISKTHGFCIDYQPASYLPSLSKHIELLNSLPHFSIEEAKNLPAFTEMDSLAYPQLELAFLVHLMINSLYY